MELEIRQIIKKSPFQRWLITLALLGCTPQLSCASGDTIQLTVRGNIIQAELAATERARTIGLMHRKKLCGNCGMLFVFPSAGKWAFWSKNTPLALSVAFIDDKKRVVQLVDMEPNSTDIHAAGHEVIYALEMARGWFARNGIAEGDTINGLSQFGQHN